MYPPAERLSLLEPQMRALVDAAAVFDEAGLQFVPECPLHGDRWVSEAQCICVGQRWTAVEFVQWLAVDIRGSVRAATHRRSNEFAQETQRARRMLKIERVAS
ncbi:MAG: hypothetical protein LC798_11245 [Chloroflexi bacterium]|nr:hypothetical protein [Chloroflexota bacterium]